MSYEEKLGAISLEANGDQSGNQYRFMELAAAGISVQDTAGAACLGVLQTKPEAGQIGEVGVAGVSKVEAGAVVVRGANVMSDASGRAITATATNFSQGIALEAATAAGKLIAVLLRPQAPLNV